MGSQVDVNDWRDDEDFDLSNNYSLENLWEQILSAIGQLATQALMKQHGCLISHHGNAVRIGLKSYPLLKIAQAKISSLEVACQKVFNTKIQVNLEVKMQGFSSEVHSKKTPISQKVQSPSPPLLKPQSLNKKSFKNLVMELHW